MRFDGPSSWLKRTCNGPRSVGPASPDMPAGTHPK